MSYDLYFQTPEPTPREFFTHFRNRQNYEINELQAWYQNEDTGVYFSFELVDEDERSDIEAQGGSSGWCLFNINFLRPTFFIDEAIIELRAFTDCFGNAVFDPQIGDSQGIEISFDTLRAKWISCNNSGIRSHPDRSMGRWSNDLQATWNWNYNRASLQQSLGDSVFVPKIMYALNQGRICSVSVWTDAIPFVLPITDCVALYRDELSKKGFLRRAQPTTAIVNWATARRKLASFPQIENPSPHIVAQFERAPRGLKRWFADVPATSDLEFLAMSAVQDCGEETTLPWHDGNTAPPSI